MFNIFGKRKKVYNIAITGLSRSGKTIFLTSLIDNLINNYKFHHDLAYAKAEEKEGNTFHWKENANKIKDKGEWPLGTKKISDISIDLYDNNDKVQSTLNFMDYPGEWILDFRLLNQEKKMDYKTWSIEFTKVYKNREEMQLFYEKLENTNLDSSQDASELSKLYTEGLLKLRENHFYNLTPARFIMKDGSEDKEDFDFFPLHIDSSNKNNINFTKSELYKYCDKKYENYKKTYIKPNLKKFKNFDSQICFIDVLEMLHNGKDAHYDIQGVLRKIFDQYKYNSKLPFSKSIEKLALVGTKCDLFCEDQQENYRDLLKEICSHLNITKMNNNKKDNIKEFIISSVVTTVPIDKDKVSFERADGAIKSGRFILPVNINSANFKKTLKYPEMRTHPTTRKYGTYEALRSRNIEDLLEFILEKR